MSDICFWYSAIEHFRIAHPLDKHLFLPFRHCFLKHFLYLSTAVISFENVLQFISLKHLPPPPQKKKKKKKEEEKHQKNPNQKTPKPTNKQTKNKPTKNNNNKQQQQKKPPKNNPHKQIHLP